MPNASASSEVNARLVRSRSLARVSPIIRGSSHDNPYSAGRFNFPCAVVILMPQAKRRSQKHASASPTPAAGPLIAATIGFDRPK